MCRSTGDGVRHRLTKVRGRPDPRGPTSGHGRQDAAFSERGWEKARFLDQGRSAGLTKSRQVLGDGLGLTEKGRCRLANSRQVLGDGLGFTEKGRCRLANSRQVLGDGLGLNDEGLRCHANSRLVFGGLNEKGHCCLANSRQVLGQGLGLNEGGHCGGGLGVFEEDRWELRLDRSCEGLRRRVTKRDRLLSRGVLHHRQRRVLNGQVFLDNQQSRFRD